MRSCSLLLLGLLAALTAGTASAQWKWRDPQGQVVVSDIPPPRDTPPGNILQRPDPNDKRAGSAAATPSAAASRPGAAPDGDKPKVDPELQARRKQAETDEVVKRKAQEEKNAAIRAENCQRARGYLNTLDSGVRVARVNNKGEREILDDKARADETVRARKVIESECN